jgi:putative flippase GtrA
VGVVATLVHYATLVILVDVLAIASATVATVVGSVVGIATSYVGNHSLVFRANADHLRFAPRFGLLYGLVMGLHGGLMYLCTEVFEAAYAWGFVAATALSSATTFLANRYFVFVPRRIARRTLWGRG